MSEKKDLLPFILVAVGPQDLTRFRCMATDAAVGMQISKWVSTKRTSEWADGVASQFADFVDPRTLQQLKSLAEEIVRYVSEGRLVWVVPAGIVMPR